MVSAIVRLAPWVHSEEVQFERVVGTKKGNEVRIGSQSRFGIAIKGSFTQSTKLALDNQVLQVHHHLIKLGAATREIFTPGDTLSGLVNYRTSGMSVKDKNDAWVRAARNIRDVIDVTDGVRITIKEEREIRISSGVRHCFITEVSGLSPGDSIKLQKSGLYGGSRFGLGVMRPIKKR